LWKGTCCNAPACFVGLGRDKIGLHPVDAIDAVDEEDEDEDEGDLHPILYFRDNGVLGDEAVKRLPRQLVVVQPGRRYNDSSPRDPWRIQRT
jgi:hypothetical protein